jgi:hypothetical protein
MDDQTLIPGDITIPKLPVSQMSERELLEEMVENTRAVRLLVADATEKVGPTLDALGKNPMFKMLGLGR